MEKKVSYSDYSRALHEAKAKLGDFHIELYDRGSRENNFRIDMGVNWGALGTVSAEEATEFAEALTKAAELATNFPYNGYTIEY